MCSPQKNKTKQQQQKKPTNKKINIKQPTTIKTIQKKQKKTTKTKQKPTEIFFSKLSRSGKHIINTCKSYTLYHTTQGIQMKYGQDDNTSMQ